MKYPQLVSMPSAVSDWLEQQLEARGIDSEVYTHYILSLLHAHTLDFIYPEDELPLSSLKKNVSRGSHKPIRHPGIWWRYADPDQIKRSAAIECLMSAADQGCEIESLVDELCEKLKEVNSESDSSPDQVSKEEKCFKPSLKQKKASPKELAEKYYAAFPSLNQREEKPAFSSDNNNLVADKAHDVISAKFATSGSPKKIKRKSRRQFYETNMKPTYRAVQKRNRSGYKRTHCGRSLNKRLADGNANFQFINNTNDYQRSGHRFHNDGSALEETYAKDIDMCEIDENDSPVCRIQNWLNDIESEKDYKTKIRGSKKRTRRYDNANYIPLYPTAVWSDNQYSLDDIWKNNREETQSCTSKETAHMSWSLEGEESAIRDEYQRPVKKEIECAIKEEYDRPHELCCHERMVPFDGQWDVNFNTTPGKIWDDANTLRPSQGQMIDASDAGRDLQRKGVDNQSSIGDMNRRLLVASVIRKLCNADEIDGNEENFTLRSVPKIPPLLDFNYLFDDKTLSLMMVNHSRENSAFCEYRRPSSFDEPLKADNPSVMPIGHPRVSEEQKRASPNMYFEPIKNLPSQEETNGKRLQDGTTFNIQGSLDEVKFERSATGSLFLETEFGEYRKYFEYVWRPPSDEFVKLPKARKTSERDEFHIKYWVSPNDKSCQTVEAALPLEQNGEIEFHDIIIASKSNRDVKEKPSEDDYLLEQEADSLCEIGEVAWDYVAESSQAFCKYCNVSHPWPNNSLKSMDVAWDERTLKDIWGGAEICQSCPWNTKGPTDLIDTTTKLREESKEEAERLLSDLSSLQLSYSSILLEAPSKASEEPREKKRRHSYMNGESDLWSFTTRLQEDCMIRMSSLPTRHSVTL